MKILDKSQVIDMHNSILEVSGGSEGVRDEGLLESALNAPFQTFGGENLVPSLEGKAAGMCYRVVMNLPFVDGNKRVGALVMLNFLAVNGIEVLCSSDVLCEIILRVATGKVSAESLTGWIEGHVRERKEDQT